jgi:hypothetical protein
MELDRTNRRVTGVATGRLRGRTAERLDGDPKDLIRAIPANGDHPQAVF